MTIATFYLAICIASICIGANGIGSIGGMHMSAPESISLIYVAAFAVAIVGVPHGGLDHWTGRRLLIPYFSQRWWLMFFPAYLTIAIVFAAGWLVSPVFTVVLFFLISAWHFGREEDKASRSVPTNITLQSHLAAIATGGLVLWIPALLRGEEMRTLLRNIVPMTNSAAAQEIVTITQILAILLLPLAFVVLIRRMMADSRDVNNWVPLATIALAATAPILLSFTVYFCGWHSLHGLQRLQREEGLSNAQFLKSVAPLSMLAVGGIALAGWYFQDASTAVTTSELANRQATLQTLFIGLSAIAVPHLLLHEVADYINVNRSKYNQVEPRFSGELVS